MLPHEAEAIGNSHGSSGSSANSSNAKSATDVNAVLFPNALPVGGAVTMGTTTQTMTTTSGGASVGVCVTALKLIEETLQYLTKVINYAPEESISCLRQLLKYLFARNYGNRLHQQQKQIQHLQKQQQNSKQGHCLTTFIKTYFNAKCKALYSVDKENDSSAIITPTPTSTTTPTTPAHKQTNQPTSPPPSSSSAAASSSSFRSMLANVFQQVSTAASKPVQLSTKTTAVMAASVLPDDFSFSAANSPVSLDYDGNGNSKSDVVDSQDNYLLLAKLFASGKEYHTWKSRHESELSKNIKLFEPLVIYCLTVSSFQTF